MQIRPASAEEIPEIVDLINLAFQVEKFFIDGDRIDLQRVRDLYTTGEFLVACDGGALAGCVYIEPRGDRAYLGLLSVQPSMQGSGLGSRLVTAAEERCRAKGASIMELNVVNLREELPPFYRKRGYTDEGTAPFPEGEPTKLPCHFVRMSKRL